MMIVRTTDNRNPAAAETAGINRYQRSDRSRSGFVRNVANTAVKSEQPSGSTLGDVLLTPPTRILTIGRSSGNNKSYATRRDGIESYRRTNDFFERNRPQIQQSAAAYLKTRPVQQTAVSALQGTSGLARSTALSVFSSPVTGSQGISSRTQNTFAANYSPVSLIQQGIRQYQIIGGSKQASRSLLGTSAELYLNAGTKPVNEGSLFGM